MKIILKYLWYQIQTSFSLLCNTWSCKLWTKSVANESLSLSDLIFLFWISLIESLHLTKSALEFLIKFSRCSFVTLKFQNKCTVIYSYFLYSSILTIILYLGIGINIEVLSCWGFKFIPEAFNDSKTAGIACGNDVMLRIIVLGFFLTIWAKSWITYSSPSNVTGNESSAPEIL